MSNGELLHTDSPLPQKEGVQLSGLKKNVRNNTRHDIKKFVGTVGLAVSLAVPPGYANGDESISGEHFAMSSSSKYIGGGVTLTPEMYKYSPYSVKGANVYSCTLEYYLSGKCTGIDQENLDSLELSGIGSYEIAIITYNGGEKALAYNGAINRGSAANFIAAHVQNPEIDTIFLNSTGGLSQEADMMAEYIRSRKLNTRVLGPWYCMSACSSVVMSGNNITIDGVVGIHSPRRRAVNPMSIPEIDTLEKILDRVFSDLFDSIMIWIEEGKPIDDSLYSLIQSSPIEDLPSDSKMLSVYIGKPTSFSQQIKEGQEGAISYLLGLAENYKRLGGKFTDRLIFEVLKSNGDYLVFESFDALKEYSGQEMEGFSEEQVKKIVEGRETLGFTLDKIKKIRSIQTAGL